MSTTIITNNSITQHPSSHLPHTPFSYNLHFTSSIQPIHLFLTMKLTLLALLITPAILAMPAGVSNAPHASHVPRALASASPVVPAGRRAFDTPGKRTVKAPGLVARRLSPNEPASGAVVLPSVRGVVARQDTRANPNSNHVEVFEAKLQARQAHVLAQISSVIRVLGAEPSRVARQEPGGEEVLRPN